MLVFKVKVFFNAPVPSNEEEQQKDEGSMNEEESQDESIRDVIVYVSD